ncbi:MAG: hypothetical protein ACT4P3_01470 [Betaproteobacteria bacterium]
MKKAPHEAVARWLGGQDEESLYLGVLTLGELEKKGKRGTPLAVIDSLRQHHVAWRLLAAIMRQRLMMTVSR